jgi:Ca-activated chloride channel family protein
LLLTDGANDVNERAGDDHGLLAGSSGLQVAADAVRQSGIDVFPIGLGDQRSIDEAAMARLGTRPPLITFDLTELRKAFQVPQIQQHGRLTATLQAPPKYGSRTLLAGRVLHFRAKLTLADGSILVENRQAPWAAPPVATPSFEGECTDAEQRALLTDARAEHGSLWAMLRPIVVFVVLSGILAFLWFALPRLLWPERYDHRAFRPIRADYWPESQVPSREASHFMSRHAPPGFEPVRQGAKVPVRGPGEHTIVQQKTEFDPNKTRLS